MSILAASTPPEPPVGSVVLDKTGRAWQLLRGMKHWLAAGATGETGIFGGPAPYSWTGLLVAYGPLQMVHNPEVPELGTDITRALAGRIENVRTHIGQCGDSTEAVVARLDELGAIAAELRGEAQR
ncbi:hypothetical protein ACL02T_33080 [Pseudonocardia sp. RS010]|uniref:hypothetical protein n=1 Tax=Pseudonocardia sp. RS010 TaxID=3385979 RepID=UPI0039A12095